MSYTCQRNAQDSRRRAAVAVQVAVMMTTLLGFAALVIDVGYLYETKGELQNAADAAALAGAMALFTEDGVDSQAGLDAAVAMLGSQVVMAKAILAAGDMKLEVNDVQIGRYDDPLDANDPFVPISDGSANTVWVTAPRREAEGTGVGLFFASIFGRHAATLTARAAAARVPVDTADLVPVALRTPDFGSVDPAIAQANPGKDGPSYPANGSEFALGEEVVVFLFGQGPRSPVHLVLDLPEYHGVAETNKMLSGEMPPAPVSVGDEMPVWNQGTGDGNFGVKLEDRLQNEDPADDTIVMPIVDTLDPPDSSRDEDGQLAGDVRIVDFVGVRLLRVEDVSVPNPRFPDNPSKNITVQRLVGVVVPVVVSGDTSAVLVNRYANSVVSVQLVR